MKILKINVCIIFMCSKEEISYFDALSTAEIFQLYSSGVTLEVCNVGATITKLLVPRGGSSSLVDDIVLGYKNPVVDLLRTKNPSYLGGVVGRVANRIANGIFELDQHTGPTKYQLDRNDGSNHLHGGFVGFNLKVWQAEEIDETCIRFTLISQDGDQHYPGSVKVVTTYSLVPCSDSAVAVRVEFHAELVENETKCSPINLAQHSYFNLAGHGAPEGILDHTLYLPSSKYYTPVNKLLIPTGEVRDLAKDDLVMDFGSHPKLMKDALLEYGKIRLGLSEEEVTTSVSQRVHPSTSFGFDHNYVVNSAPSCSDLSVAAILEHEPTKRRLTVRTNAPGVQVYSGNFLDGLSPPPTESKEGSCYKKWQSICLETQHYPNSINAPETVKKEDETCFSRGRCHILKPGGRNYDHVVEYELAW